MGFYFLFLSRFSFFEIFFQKFFKPKNPKIQPKKKPSPIAKEEKPILMPEIVKTKKEPKFDIRADVLNVTEPESKKSRKRRDSGREQLPQVHCHGPKVSFENI